MKVAAIQMVSGVDVMRNLESARKLVFDAAARGAELVALPEYFCALGMQDTDKLVYAEDWREGVIQQALSQWARETGVWLLGGTLPLKTKDPQRVTNTSMLWNPQGQQVVRYDKVHLFRFSKGVEHYDESVRIAAGRDVVCAALVDRGGDHYKLGLSVCYDLRFPELFRQQAAQGMDLLVVPSAFTYTTGRAHWQLLLRARAVENQCYVLAPAQGGVHENGRHTWGHSMLISPWGDVLAEQCEEGPGIVEGDVDLAHLREIRQQLPALEHRVL